MQQTSSNFLSKDTRVGLPPTPHQTILDLFNIQNAKDAHFVAIVAHDDDWAIGGGRTTKALTEQGVKVSVIVTTDGANGYGDPKVKDQIIKIRKDETVSAYQALGIANDDIKFLDFPDLGLNLSAGRITAQSQPGMMQAYVETLRSLTPKPTHIFLHSELDPHPDHLDTRKVSLFAAGCLAIGDSWQEIPGGMWGFRPRIFEYLVYRTPADPKDFQLTHVHLPSKDLTDEVGKLLKNGWASQSIDDLIELLKNRPFDGFREYNWQGCHPDDMLNEFFGGQAARQQFLDAEK